MTRRYLPLVALLFVVAGCDFKETRSGQIVLTAGSAGIPLNAKAGAATLVAGSAEITFKKGSSDNRVAVKIRQAGRADVEFEAPVSKGYESGNFALKSSDSGQPVDMASARGYAVTGPREQYSNWENQGNQQCLVTVSYDPCDENWSVNFASPSGAALGSFAARTATRCNENRGIPTMCHQDPSREPRIPDFPRGGGRHVLFNQLHDTGADNVKFD